MNLVYARPMFDFLEEETESSSQDRYDVRQALFVHDGRPLPKIRHAALWMLHNCIAHPILAVMPTRPAVEFHDLTSSWLNHRHRYLGSRAPLPRVSNRRWWLLHNALSHPLIGLLPVSAAFKLHDISAKKMDVPGWV